MEESQGMRPVLKTLLFTVVLGGLASCASSPTESPSTNLWDKYSPVVKERIDGMAVVEDCVGLQAEFDQAAANDSVTRDRTGSGTADLMAYIDKQLRAAGCYG